MSDKKHEIYESVLQEFLEICKIPHISNSFFPFKEKDTLKQIKEYLVNKIKEYGAQPQTDKYGNIWFDIPASKGYENYKKLVMQGHVDMVWEATGEATKWDKDTHPIAEPVIEKVKGLDAIHTKGYLTTLGADNADALAICLAFLKHKDDFNHGLIRCIFTTDEESGCNGAKYLGEQEDGSRTPVIPASDGFNDLINLDYFIEGNIVSTSASVNVCKYIIGHLKKQKVKGKLYTISLFNLLGGHSGLHIYQGRANAIKIVAECLSLLNDSTLKLSSWSTTIKGNSQISVDSTVKFLSTKSKEEVEEIVNQKMANVISKYPKEKDLKYFVSCQDEEEIEVIIDPKDSKAIIDFVCAVPYGPLTYFKDDGVIESSANISPAVLDLNETDEQFVLYSFVRAASEELTEKHRGTTNKAFDVLTKSIPDCKNNAVMISNSKPFPYKPGNHLLKIAQEAYTKNNIKHQITKCHGGLECSYFIELNKDINMVSLGPNLVDEHTTVETLFLDSYERLVNVIIDICELMK